MNYTMGRYVNELDDEARDRLIRADGFIVGRTNDDKGQGCLVGVASGAAASGEASMAWRGIHRMAIMRGVGRRFNRAYRRFGDRLTRAIKLRAAQGMTTEALERDGVVERAEIPETVAPH